LKRRSGCIRVLPRAGGRGGWPKFGRTQISTACSPRRSEPGPSSSLLTGGSSPAASEREQSEVRIAAAGTLELLAAENRLYEARFGHVFLIAAAGKSADEILAALRRRMENDAVTEARIAAAEHRKIARSRLEALIPSPRGGED
jgi:2-oxo-4-hydroxy-4-carboxy--5-ureidoimidazoline (OHCU) decarboxylase